MLENINLNDKSYNDILDGAVNMIPILSDEWTDYNYADPGITILQILSFLNLTQQSYVNQVNDKIKINLLKLLGYVTEPITAGIALAAIKTPKNQVIKPNTKFYVTEVSKDAIIFEPREEFLVVDNEILNVISMAEGVAQDITVVVTNNSRSNFAQIFKTNVWQQELLIGMRYPLPNSEFINFYFDMVEEFKFSSVDPDGLSLCDVVWEYFAQGSWRKLCAEDQTFSFSRSGVLRVKTKLTMDEFESLNVPRGFYIRARVSSGRFDLAPKLKRVILNAIELFGQDSLARSVLAVSDGTGEQAVVLKTDLARYNNFTVLCQEDEKYFEYQLFEERKWQKDGRYFTVSDRNGYTCINFSKSRFGFAPDNKGAEIKVIVYNKTNTDFLSLGRVYGYDDQRIEFDFNEIAEQNLEFMLRVDKQKGTTWFIKCPKKCDNTESSDLEYTLDYKNGVVVIHNNANYSGELFAVSCAICKGDGANIKSGEVLKFSAADIELLGEVSAHNIEDVSNGKNRETLTELLRRAVWDIESLGVAITEKDYLELLEQTPGVGIDKINIIPDRRGGEVTIVLKIKSDQQMPVLSDRHKEMFTAQIEKHRPLATSIKFISPCYIPIDVAGEIFVRPSFRNASELIYNKLIEELDGVRATADFGQDIIYGKIYSELENLECVERIGSLEFGSSSEHARKDENGNLILADFSLSYLNSFQVIINTNIVTVI